MSAFGLARAMAEEAGSAHIEEAPVQADYGEAYEGDMAEALETLDAPVEETTFELDGGEETLPGETMAAMDAVFAAAEAQLPANPAFEIGARKIFKLNALARACGIEGEVTDVGVTDDDDIVKFVVFTDDEGDLAIEFTRSFDALELGFITENGIDTVTLTHAVIEEEAQVEAAEAPDATEADSLMVEYEEVVPEIGGEVDEPAYETEAPESENLETVESAPIEAEYTLVDDGLDESGEADSIDQANARHELMTGLIDSAMEANQEQGIYAALDSTFDTLAENAEPLSDPETGSIDVGDGEMVGLTLGALQYHFDATPEQFMGAIGAAALRAEERGALAPLSGDCTLAAMAADESASHSGKQPKKYYKAVYEGGLDGLALVFPEFKPFVPLFKAPGGTLFFDGATDNTNADILARLNELEAVIGNTEQRLKDSMYNVVSLGMIGDKYNTVRDKAATIRTLIGDIEGNDKLTGDQKLQQIADLYKDSEFKALTSAMNGATDCFYSQENDIFTNGSIFDAAYNRACENVMFSREALLISMPYVMRQYAIYSAAYGTMAIVYDANEQVYGANAVTESRKLMARRLYGQDLYGNPVGKSILDLFVDYFSRDPFIFVCMSNNTNIPLNRNILVNFAFGTNCIAGKQHYDKWVNTPDYMSRMPLSDEQVESLAQYCGARNKTIFDFLFNEMGFLPNGIALVDNSAKITELQSQIEKQEDVKQRYQKMISNYQLDLERLDANVKQWEQEIEELKRRETRMDYSLDSRKRNEQIMLKAQMEERYKKIQQCIRNIEDIKAHMAIYQDKLPDCEDKLLRIQMEFDRCQYEMADCRIRFNEQEIADLNRQSPSKVGPIEQKDNRWTVSGDVYLADGAQTLSRHRPGGGSAWVDYRAVNATKIGAGSETLTLDKCSINAYGGIFDHKYQNRTVIFFQAR